LLERHGALIVNADESAKRLMVDDESLRAQLVERFGRDVYLPDGALNKPFVSTLVFGSDASRKEVNSIVHPKVYAAFSEQALAAERKGVPVIVLESAVLFDAGERPEFDAIVAVQASETSRIERTLARDQTTADQVEQRIRRQLSDTLFAERAHFVIVNDGTLDDLQESVAVLYEALVAPASKKA